MSTTRSAPWLLAALVPGAAFSLHPLAPAVRPWGPDLSRSGSSGACDKPRLVRSNGRAAVVLWKESFRGYSGLLRSVHVPPRVLCTPQAMDVQKALAANHLDKLIQPLEKSYGKVDVFLFSQVCGATMQKHLLHWYDHEHKRVVLQSFQDHETQFETASWVAREMTQFLSGSIFVYDVLVFSRFDLVFSDNYFASAHYLQKASNEVFAMDDWFLSVPGWMSECLLAPLAQECRGVTLDDKRSIHQWFQCFTSNLEYENFHNLLGIGLFIYRGPVGWKTYSGLPVKMCNFLHREYGGPRCRAEDLARYSCQNLCRLIPPEPRRRGVVVQESKRQESKRQESKGQGCLASFWAEVDRQRREQKSDEVLEEGTRIMNCSK